MVCTQVGTKGHIDLHENCFVAKAYDVIVTSYCYIRFIQVTTLK